jgi:hypothetical protein
MKPCAWCGLDAIVTVNGKEACLDHLDVAMGEAVEPARILWGKIREAETRSHDE